MRTIHCLGLVLASSLACGGLPSGNACLAQGVYTVCVDQGGWESCEDRASEGLGEGPDAAADALAMCSDHMAQMVVINNMGGRASIKVSCQIARCE